MCAVLAAYLTVPIAAAVDLSTLLLYMHAKLPQPFRPFCRLEHITRNRECKRELELLVPTVPVLARAGPRAGPRGLLLVVALQEVRLENDEKVVECTVARYVKVAPLNFS